MVSQTTNYITQAHGQLLVSAQCNTGFVYCKVMMSNDHRMINGSHRGSVTKFFGGAKPRVPRDGTVSPQSGIMSVTLHDIYWTL